MKKFIWLFLIFNGVVFALMFWEGKGDKNIACPSLLNDVLTALGAVFWLSLASFGLSFLVDTTKRNNPLIRALKQLLALLHNRRFLFVYLLLFVYCAVTIHRSYYTRPFFLLEAESLKEIEEKGNDYLFVHYPFEQISSQVEWSCFGVEYTLTHYSDSEKYYQAYPLKGVNMFFVVVFFGKPQYERFFEFEKELAQLLQYQPKSNFFATGVIGENCEIFSLHEAGKEAEKKYKALHTSDSSHFNHETAPYLWAVDYDIKWWKTLWLGIFVVTAAFFNLSLYWYCRWWERYTALYP